MGISEEIRQRLINTFKAEQQEHIQAITQGLLALEKEPASGDPSVMDEIFRAAHSLKGSARAMEMTAVAALGHGLEGVLLAAKEKRIAFSPELFDLLYQTLDAVEGVTAQVEQGNASLPAKTLALMAQLEEEIEQANQPIASALPPVAEHAVAPEAIEPTAVGSTAINETIRVSVDKLDALMAQFTELSAAKIQAKQRLAETQRLQEMALNWNKEWMALRGDYGRLLRTENGAHGKEMNALLDFMNLNQRRLRDFQTQTNALSRAVAADYQRLHLVIEALQEDIKRVRMLPLSTITAGFGRMTRDLARQQGKQLRLELSGAETELDKRVLEQIKDPLIHLLRNGIDHGIELPDERLQAGKAAEGCIRLTAVQQGPNIEITVSDNGAGLDLERIRKTAVSRHLLSAEEANALSDAETANLIFQAGFSTSKIITDISGRGVGMDVVRQNIETLHGSLRIDSHKGSGTTFVMILPLTLASARGLLIESGGQSFALPLSVVERMLRIMPQEITAVGDRPTILYRGKPVALAWLDNLLELTPSPQKPSLEKQDKLPVVIINVADKQLGLVVDKLNGEQEIITKSLGKQLTRVGGIAGATLTGSGEALLVLHPADLIKLAAKVNVRPPAAIAPRAAAHELQKRIMVVDDSITTRILEKNSLEAAGYDVALAVNGEEALGVLVDQAPHLIVSDVNMPRMDGFEMTERIKQDGRYQHIPVILVTSLESPADKAKGIKVGADAYIVKSAFDQGNLLTTIKQLI